MTSQQSREGGGEDLTDPPAPTKSKLGVKFNYKNLREWQEMLFKDNKYGLIRLYRIQVEGLVRLIMSDMPELRIVGPSTDQELLDKALSYCLAKSPRSHRIIFDTCTISPETEEILSPGFGKCSYLRIQHCDLTSLYQDLLYSAVTNRSLITLIVSQSALQYKGVKHLCEGLSHLDCVVQELQLEHCDLTPFCFEELSSAIITNQSLVTLDLSYNDPQDSGMKHLCDGLRNPQCKLKELQLRHCDLTSSCCEDLCSVIIINRYLIKLDLSLNNLQDSGVQLLCEGLRHPDCVLQELRLQQCGLTSSCCEDLRSVITTNQSLITLDLSQNNLQDSEVKQLCEGFTDPACVLQELRLWDCCQTPFNEAGLLCYYIINRSLTTLDLSYKSLGNETLKHLCEGLRHPDCILQELRLQCCGLTSSSCVDLRSVIATNHSLIKLDLSWNKLEDFGVIILCEGLRYMDCILQELRLERCDLTSSCCADLRFVMITLQSLITLDLSHNNLRDSGVMRLCEGLWHPGCLLQELRLESCGLTSSCCEGLHFGITNKFLIKLDLSLNDLQDSGVKRLCEGLGRSGRVLQELRLQRCGLTSSCCEDLRSVNTTNQSLITLDLARNDLQDSGVKRPGVVDHLIQQALWLCDYSQTVFDKVGVFSSIITDRSLTTLDLSYKRLEDRTLKSLCEGLRHPDCVVKELRLKQCDLTSSFCEDLRSVFATNRSLIKLDLSQNKLEDSGVKHLCEGLRHLGCVLQELRLKHCDLTSSCCADLRSAFITNRSLIKLGLSYNNLQDSGVMRLCDGLWHPGCYLQELRLERCGLTPFSCEGLRFVILTNQSLIKLNLSRNKLEDSGVKRLCEGLRRPDCVLQELRLQQCGLTSSCCEDLRSVITTNQSQITLDLSQNSLHDSVKRLYEGLGLPDYVQQELRLWDYGQTPLIETGLISYIITNRFLTTLDLSYNRLEDRTLKSLCEGLRHPDSIMKELWLRHCDLTSSSCEDLRSVIATNQSLIKLDLSLNKLEDLGLILLCEGLRYSRYILQELRLERCDLTSSCCADLRSVFIRHTPLLTLDLSHNKLQDSGMIRLCEGLSYPGCLLQELRLARCGLTSSCCWGLRSGIRNQFLIKLDLSYNNLQDSGVKHLCAGLGGRGCVLQELRLHRCNLTFSGIECLLNTSNQSLKKLEI